MEISNRVIRYLICWVIVFLWLVPLALFAADPKYVPLVGIPGLNPESQDAGAYVKALYLLAISIAAFLAVVKIIFGGVQYMLSDVITSKEQAKKDIRGALLGLLIVLAAVLVLNTINPNLTNLNILDKDNLQIDTSIYNGQFQFGNATAEEMCKSDYGCSNFSCYVDCSQCAEKEGVLVRESLLTLKKVCYYENAPLNSLGYNSNNLANDGQIAKAVTAYMEANNISFKPVTSIPINDRERSNLPLTLETVIGYTEVPKETNKVEMGEDRIQLELQRSCQKLQGSLVKIQKDGQNSSGEPTSNGYYYVKI